MTFLHVGLHEHVGLTFTDKACFLFKQSIIDSYMFHMQIEIRFVQMKARGNGGHGMICSLKIKQCDQILPKQSKDQQDRTDYSACRMFTFSSKRR